MGDELSFILPFFYRISRLSPVVWLGLQGKYSLGWFTVLMGLGSAVSKTGLSAQRMREMKMDGEG